MDWKPVQSVKNAKNANISCMFCRNLSKYFLDTTQPVHFRRQAPRKGVAVVKAATHKYICTKDGVK